MVNTQLPNTLNASKYFFMLMMVLWSAKTSLFLKIDPNNPLVIIHLLIIGLYFFKYCKKMTLKPLWIILGTFISWYVAICIKYNGIQEIYFGLLTSTIIVYIAFHIYNKCEFFIYAEKVLVHLCLFSLVIWGGYVIMPTLIGAIMDAISMTDNAATMRANILLVGIGNQTVDGLSIKRNIGFTWEAGRFSCFLVFAMFLNLSLKNMSLSWKKNKSLYILLIGIISTISTTGIMALFSIVLYYAYNKSAAYRTGLFFVGILFIPVIWGMSFMGEKLLGLIDYEKEIQDMQWMFNHGSESITPQRITGAYLELQNFIHDFWLGYNVNENAYATSVLFDGQEVWLANGVIQIFSQYGIFIALLFYISLFKSSSQITMLFSKKGSMMFALMFLLISVSYEFWTSSIFLYCIYYCLFNYYISGNEIIKHK